MSLFVPLNLEERDSEIQAIFEKNSFFCVGGKIIPGVYNGCKRAKMIVSTSTHVSILNKVVESNKCPLKVSLVGVPQEMPIGIKDDSVINTLVTDFSGQEHNFIMKVVFSHHNSHLSHLKDIIRPQKSLIFVVGQLEIIGNEFYVYSKDINYIDTRFTFSYSSNIVGGSEEKLDNETLVDSNDFVDNYDFNSMGSSCSAKHAKFDDFDESFDDTLVNFESESRSKEDGCLSDCGEEGVKEAVKDSKDKRNVSRSEGKKPVERSLHSSLRGSNSVKT
ncbi:10099_t:CDS:2 [Dentiscutata erythropus]|uniref:10099_t:CDS:1 n=1 Tax=Dentiscutata erythropus TaxID=1348616 RepID=A0A9N9ISU8_9GLOM|nr:10099_t:CDS:2 [Dentiscutata erythropus]